MITRTATTLHTATWQQSQAQAIRDPAELLEILRLPASLLPAAQAAAQQFPLRVPCGYVDRMEKGNPQDPLLLQVLPMGFELTESEGFAPDPVGDLTAMVRPGLLHKYHGRVLMITTGACGIHCRYCFRRHFPYSETQRETNNWQPALAYIAADPSIEEVILSGGDPLCLTNQRLMALTRKLASIPHVRRLRIHTRQPIVLPERVDTGLLEWLNTCEMQVIVVLHCNHTNEINTEVCRALAAIKGTGAALLNQAVLLRGINDDTEVLVDLNKNLFYIGVLPYYLHQLDRVQGSQHFEVAPQRAREIMRELRDRLPGYLVPNLVREETGQLAKRPIEMD